MWSLPAESLSIAIEKYERDKVNIFKSPARDHKYDWFVPVQFFSTLRTAADCRETQTAVLGHNQARQPLQKSMLSADDRHAWSPCESQHRSHQVTYIPFQ